MRKSNQLITLSLALLLAVSVLFSPLSTLVASAANETRRYMGTVVNAGHDTGFSEENKITEKDPHFSWTLGSFYVDGYTRVTEDDNKDPIFLKNVGDTVTLWFQLDQDITKLNDNKMLSINEDTNGYDEYFGVEKTNFGRGTLIIRHTDYQNHVGAPQIYTDYLAAVTAGAAIEVKLCEEGDYEVALDYEIREDNFDIFGWNPLPTYHDYRIFFRFSVRNGNCMVYPFEYETNRELTNSSITEKGFYLDLANSRYLNIDIKKEIRREGAEGLTEDVRFNKPAKDGELYTDEGIYTITVSNLYTHQTTTKVIYVGTDDVLKAYVTTGLPIDDIEYQLSLGATVAPDGTLIPPPEETIPPTEETTPPVETEPEETVKVPEETEPPVVELPVDKPPALWPFITGGVVLAAIIAVVIVLIKKKKSAIPNGSIEKPETDDNGEGAE